MISKNCPLSDKDKLKSILHNECQRKLFITGEQPLCSSCSFYNPNNFTVLTVTPQASQWECNIFGTVKIVPHKENTPNWFQRKIHSLLGIKWKKIK